MTGKQNAREFLEQRRIERKPPPDLKEIRRMLGWGLVEKSRDGKTRS
jgi:hypothetical protein